MASINLIIKLPVELHLPGFQFRGPGTKLQKRLAREDKGIHLLDADCREQNIAYSKSKDIKKIVIVINDHEQIQSRPKSI